MKMCIDADGCPVVKLAVPIAREYQIPCTLFCDTAHEIEYEGASTVTVSKGADSADFALVNAISAGDLVITQDYGLAAMCLARGALVLHQDGYEYTEENIEALLLSRHTAQKIRRAGGRMPTMKKRAQSQNDIFCAILRRIIEHNI